MSKTIFCLANTEFQAESILNELRFAGLKDDAFSVLLADKTRAIVRGVTGGLNVDSAVGWLPQVQPLTISGAGAFIGNGIMMEALQQAVAGSHKGAIARAFAGLGLDSEQAEKFEEELRGGKVLMAVQSEQDEQAHVVCKVIDEGGGQQVLTTSEPAPVEAAPRLREEKWEKW